MTSMNPTGEKMTSPMTMRITPAVMVAMMRTRRREGVSRRKRKAKRRTKAREEDLHIAGGRGVSSPLLWDGDGDKDGHGR